MPRCDYWECKEPIAPEDQNIKRGWRLCAKHNAEFETIVADEEHFAPRIMKWWIDGMGGPEEAAKRL